MKRNLLAWSLVFLLALTALCGCGSAGGDKTAASANGAASSPAEPAGGDFGQEDAAAESAGTAQPRPDMLQTAKLIYTGSLEMETTAFDGVLESLRALVDDCGGYMESSSVSNRGSGYRRANYTVRVPSAQYGRFFSEAGELCHVTWKNEDVQNISTVYYDTAGRLKTQQTKLDRLQELLSRAESMEDIITIESAISETEQAIESISGELRQYDALVDYATVYLSIDEVYKLSNTEEPATGFLSRMGAAFSSGWRGFVNVLEGLAVALAYGWVFVLLAAAAAAVLVCWLRKRRRGGPKKPDDKPL